MRRQRGLISELNSLVGSVTHWMFGASLELIYAVLGIEVAPEITQKLAYVLTGLFLVGIGVWGSLRWF